MRTLLIWAVREIGLNPNEPTVISEIFPQLTLPATFLFRSSVWKSKTPGILFVETLLRNLIESHPHALPNFMSERAQRTLNLSKSQPSHALF